MSRVQFPGSRPLGEVARVSDVSYSAPENPWGMFVWVVKFLPGGSPLELFPRSWLVVFRRRSIFPPVLRPRDSKPRCRVSVAAFMMRLQEAMTFGASVKKEASEILGNPMTCFMWYLLGRGLPAVEFKISRPPTECETPHAENPHPAVNQSRD